MATLSCVQTRTVHGLLLWNPDTASQVLSTGPTYGILLKMFIDRYMDYRLSDADNACKLAGGWTWEIDEFANLAKWMLVHWTSNHSYRMFVCDRLSVINANS